MWAIPVSKLGSPLFFSAMKFGHLEGENHNPILRGFITITMGKLTTYDRPGMILQGLGICWILRRNSQKREGGGEGGVRSISRFLKLENDLGQEKAPGKNRLCEELIQQEPNDLSQKSVIWGLNQK